MREEVLESGPQKDDHGDERGRLQERDLQLEALLRGDGVDGADLARGDVIHLLDARLDVLVGLADGRLDDTVGLREARLEDPVGLVEQLRAVGGRLARSRPCRSGRSAPPS